LAKDPNSVQPDLLSVAITINTEYDQRRNMLELNEAQFHFCRAGLFVPVSRIQYDRLCWPDIICLFETDDMRAIDVEFQRLGSHGRVFLFFSCRRRKRSYLQRMDLE